MSDVAIPSTGDPAEDERILDRYALQEARMQENICPNGCGQMTITNEHVRDCPVCHFHGWSNKPHGFTAPTEPVELPEQS